MVALINSDDKNKVQEQEKAFVPLLKVLTAPSSMCLSSHGKINEKVINVLATLTALVESVPTLFMNQGKNDRGRKAVHFALEHVLLGLEKDEEHNESKENSEEETEVTSPPKRKMKRQIDVDDLSLTCQRAIAAIDFLVCHIRSTLLLSRKSPSKEKKKQQHFVPTDEHISSVFEILINLVRDGGVLPSIRDRHECNMFSDRGALRKCAAVSLLRLCDGSLNIESKYLTPKYWHILSKAFVDEEYQVRGTLNTFSCIHLHTYTFLIPVFSPSDAVMNELSMMLVGEGQYRQGTHGFLPSLRFLACISLCPDDDHHSSGSSVAKVGRRANTVKGAALNCIISLRKTSEDALLQCRAISKKAEKNFENNLKMKLMPEFAVPYAFHLLSFRSESPCGGYIRRRSSEEELDDEELDKEEVSHKLLRKRLRWLLEPLVQSLGDGADNISFLLRLTELLGQRYRPIDVLNSDSSMSFPLSPFSDISFGENDNKENDELSQAKLKVICTEAREMLLTFVKKDSNLDPYPGAIQIPSLLYTRSKQARTSPAKRSKPTSDTRIQKMSTAEKSTPNSGAKRRKVEVKNADIFSEIEKEGDTLALSINLSPIPQSRSPTGNYNKKSMDINKNKETTRSQTFYCQNHYEGKG